MLRTSQTKILIIFCLVLVLPVRIAFANLEISEVMYDLKTGSDDGREWIEVYNNSDKPVDLATDKFFEANTNHKITFFEGSEKIPPLGYAIIATNPLKFKTDYLNFSGNIFDSTFSLNNSGEVLAIKDGEVIVNQYEYKSSYGGAGDGNSLQKINGAWQASMPTPGGENKITFIPKPVVQKSVAPEKISISSSPKQNSTPEKIIDTLPLEPLPIQDGDEGDGSIFYIIIFIFLISVGAGVVYFIRRKKIISKIGDDFEILEGFERLNKKISESTDEDEENEDL